MSASSREQILGRVRSALAPVKERAAYPQYSDKAATMASLPPSPTTWAAFRPKLEATKAVAFDDAAALAAWLRSQNQLRGYCDPFLWGQLRAAFGEGFQVETSFDRTRVDDYQFGITRAAGAITETGSIMLNDSTTSSRLAALAPWIHVAVIPTDLIYPDIAGALAALGSDPNVIWCTGPSKTADVEGILIQGVHGPGVQVALLGV